MENKPNFLCVGAPKAGTTSLYHYLKDHPKIYMASKKEPRFFCSEYYIALCKEDPRYSQSFSTVILDKYKYYSLFNCVKNESAIGEMSVQYLYLHNFSIPRIKKILGDPKILIILRNPVDRCLSSYRRALRDDFERNSLLQAVQDESYKKKENWSLGHFHFSLGLYHEAVKAYMINFTNVKVILYDDYKDDSIGVVREIYDFLGVQKEFTPNIETKYNVSGIPISRFLHNLIIKQSFLRNRFVSLLRAILNESQTSKLRERILSINMGRSKIDISEKNFAYLKSLYKNDIDQLSNLLSKDLSHWLT